MVSIVMMTPFITPYFDTRGVALIWDGTLRLMPQDCVAYYFARLSVPVFTCVPLLARVALLCRLSLGYREGKRPHASSRRKLASAPGFYGPGRLPISRAPLRPRHPGPFLYLTYILYAFSLKNAPVKSTHRKDNKGNSFGYYTPNGAPEGWGPT